MKFIVYGALSLVDTRKSRSEIVRNALTGLSSGFKATFVQKVTPLIGDQFSK
jgi:hypothetical protein